MTPLDKLISYGIALLILVLGLWLAGDSIVDAIRAPAVQRAEKAEEANGTLVEKAKTLQEENARLNAIIQDRGVRESAGQVKLERKIDGLEKLFKTNQQAGKWAEAVVPDSVIDGMRAVPEAGTSGTNGKTGVQGSNQPDRASSNAGTADLRRDERRPSQADSDAGNAAATVQQPSSRCAGVDTPVCRVWNWVTG